MKKAFLSIILVALLLSAAACGNTGSGEPSASPQQSAGQTPANQTDSSLSAGQLQNESDSAGPTSLVVYFSWSGNTENVAKSIQRQTQSDLFEIVPVTPYSDDYDAVVDLAREERQNNARPAISDTIEDIGQYDVVYVGFPNWWGNMPMILYTFFDYYDLSGKTVALFCTSGGSGLSNTVEEVRSLEPNATVTEGLHIGSSSSAEPDTAVGDWLNNIGLAQ